ncbi:MAG: hypothetical protein SGPRY_003827 [Prymnesium sp.]
MCGFLSIHNARSSAEAIRLQTLTLQRLVRHRGPDGSGIHVIQSPDPDGDRFSSMAHERLAIVDPLSGNQPLFSHDRKRSLSVNGEIYNHKQLRAGLKNKQDFRTESDCEVIVHLYDEIGVHAASKLDGDFAFVILDEETGDVYAARDPVGINSMYMGSGLDGSMWFSSEAKALVAGGCIDVRVFPPGHYYTSKTGQLTQYYTPKWLEADYAVKSLDLPLIRETFIKSVEKRLMADVPFGVLLSGGLDSSLVASVIARLKRRRFLAMGSTDDLKPVQSFSIGLPGSPDLANAKKISRLHGWDLVSGEEMKWIGLVLIEFSVECGVWCVQVADFIGTEHFGFTFTVQEGIDAVSDVIYHLETYDVTTVRAGTPMFLLARKIKAMGVKMVLSGEGADETLAGYLYFHKAPNGRELHEECVRKVADLHRFDCLRANKATMAHGLEQSSFSHGRLRRGQVRVPFLDQDMLDATMFTDPEYKLFKKDQPSQFIEKWLLRAAFDVPEEPFLPKEVLWRQKEQFSDGVGYSWIDGLKEHAEKVISDEARMSDRTALRREDTTPHLCTC